MLHNLKTKTNVRPCHTAGVVAAWRGVGGSAAWRGRHAACTEAEPLTEHGPPRHAATTPVQAGRRSSSPTHSDQSAWLKSILPFYITSLTPFFCS